MIKNNKIIDKLIQTDWFKGLKRGNFITYNEIEPHLNNSLITEEIAEEIFDLLDQKKIYLATERQKKHPISLQTKKRNDSALLNEHAEDDFFAPYSNFKVLNKDQIEKNFIEIKNLEKELYRSFYRSLYLLNILYPFYEQLDESNFEDFKSFFSTNDIIAHIVYEKQSIYFQNWFDYQIELFQQYLKYFFSDNFQQAEAIINKIISNLNNLNWKKSQLKKIMNDYVHKKSFEFLEHNNPEIIDNLNNYIENNQKQVRKIYFQIRVFKDRIIESEMKLVIAIAKSYNSIEFDFMDLIQEGNKGLINAIDLYNPYAGHAFQSFVTKQIRNSMNNFIVSNYNALKATSSKMKILKKVRKAIDQLHQELERSPTSVEISEKTTLPLNQIIELLPLLYKHKSFQEFENTDYLELQALEHRDHIEESESNQLIISKNLDFSKIGFLLSDREEKLLKMRLGYFGVEYSFEELSQIFSLDIKEVRSILNRTIRKINRKSNPIFPQGFVVID